MNPLIDQNALLRSNGRLLFAPTELEIEKCPIILDAKEKIARLYLEHAHRICAHQVMEPFKAFVQQRYYFIGLRKTLLSIKYRCFQCRRFEFQIIQTIMAPLPAFRFPTKDTKFPFANTGNGNSGLAFFGKFYIEDTQKNRETLWTYFYMPRYTSGPFGNMSRFKYRHHPQCISTVHMPKMPTHYAVQR